MTRPRRPPSGGSSTGPATERGVDRALLLLNHIMEYKIKHDGNSPSVRELQAMLGLRSTSSVFHHLHSLRRAGLIRPSSAEHHSIEVIGGRWLPPEPDFSLPASSFQPPGSE